MPLQILLIGDTSRPEFHEASAALEEVACVTRVPNVDAAIAALAGVVQPPVGCVERTAGELEGCARSRTPENTLPSSGPVRATHHRDSASVLHPPYDGGLPPVHGIVLAQTYPDQFSVVAIDRLRKLAPLARLIAILGSWCEGEPRSGHPLQGVIRIYWHQAAVRLRREFAGGADGTRRVPATFETEGSAWRLPATASDEERLLAAVHLPLPKGNGLVAIWTRLPEMEGLLSDACRRGGYATVWLHPRQPARVQGAVAAVYDGALLDAAGLAELSQLTAAVSPARVVALLDAPRIQDVRPARTLGATVLAKPFRVDELLYLLAKQQDADAMRETDFSTEK